MVEPVVEAVDDGPIGEDRGKAPTAGLEQVRFAPDVEIALVLTGEARTGQVFGGRGAADGA
jgi:hypothetical protein